MNLNTSEQIAEESALIERQEAPLQDEILTLQPEQQNSAEEVARLTKVMKQDVYRRTGSIMVLPFIAILFLESFRKLLGQTNFITLCTNPTFLLITLAGVGITVPVWMLRPSRKARAAQEALAQYKGLPILGGLIESLYFNDLKAGHAMEAVLALLPQLTSADAHLLAERHHQVLRTCLLALPQASGNLAVSLAKRKALHARLQIAILRAFESVGTPRDLAAVSTLIKRGAPANVLEVANDCEREMHLRLDPQIASEVLLRASSANEGADVLLRATTGTPDTSPEEMLRASSGPENR